MPIKVNKVLTFVELMKKYKLIEVSEYERMLNELSNSESIDLENFDLLIYGSGGKTRNFIGT